MTVLAVLLEPPVFNEPGLEGHHFLLAGFMLLMAGAAKALMGRENPPTPRAYYLGLLFGSGAALIALGLMIGENTSPYFCDFGG